MRLGDLDALKKSMCELCHQDYSDEPCEPSDCVFYNAIENAPTIDAVPVVRCQECKRWDADPDSYGKDDGPKGKCMKSFEDTYSDDFCSYGQRKIETVLPKSDTKDESLEANHEVS